MKKTIATSLILIFSMSLSFAQQNDKKDIEKQSQEDRYKDYKPCTECFDKWSHSNGTLPGSPNVSAQTNPMLGQVANDTKRGVSTFVKTVVGIVSAAILYGVYNKVSKTTTNGAQ